MTDREIPAWSAQTSPKVLQRYVKKTMKQVANGARKRRAVLACEKVRLAGREIR